MGEKVIEALVYDFLAAAILAAADDEDDPLFDAELHRHVYQKFDDKKWFGIRIGNGASDLAPNPGATEVEEFDGSVLLVIFARIKKPDHSDVETPRTKAFAVAKEVARLFIAEDPVHGPTMGQRVNDARVLRGIRDFGEWNSSLYAVCQLPLLINDTGSGQ
jgi:hypothetical protein